MTFHSLPVCRSQRGRPGARSSLRCSRRAPSLARRSRETANQGRKNKKELEASQIPFREQSRTVEQTNGATSAKVLDENEVKTKAKRKATTLISRGGVGEVGEGSCWKHALSEHGLGFGIPR